MKSVGFCIPIILLIAVSATGQTYRDQPTPVPFPPKPNALTVCAGDVPPENFVVTATGTSDTCYGACRARQVELVEGPVMLICAGQPIPQYYEMESATTSPLCNCIADQDNAYVIRRMNNAPAPTPSVQEIPALPAPALPGAARNRPPQQ